MDFDSWVSIREFCGIIFHPRDVDFCNKTENGYRT